MAGGADSASRMNLQVKKRHFVFFVGVASAAGAADLEGERTADMRREQVLVQVKGHPSIRVENGGRVGEREVLGRFEDEERGRGVGGFTSVEPELSGSERDDLSVDGRLEVEGGVTAGGGRGGGRGGAGEV